MQKRGALRGRRVKLTASMVARRWITLAFRPAVRVCPENFFNRYGDRGHMLVTGPKRRQLLTHVIDRIRLFGQEAVGTHR